MWTWSLGLSAWLAGWVNMGGWWWKMALEHHLFLKFRLDCKESLKGTAEVWVLSIFVTGCWIHTLTKTFLKYLLPS